MSETVGYTIGWITPPPQLYRITITTSARGEPLVFSLPAWRPGRYIVQNYAANVQNVRAVDEGGIPAGRVDRPRLLARRPRERAIGDARIRVLRPHVRRRGAPRSLPTPRTSIR